MTCCKKGEVCAQVADASGTVPVANLRRFTCCQKDRVVEFARGVATCCPPGYRSLGGRFVLPAFGGGGLGTCCNGTCVSLFFDPQNCGSCGNVCPPGTVCRSGGCVTA